VYQLKDKKVYKRFYKNDQQVGSRHHYDKQIINC
jgi:hypothetical protein